MTKAKTVRESKAPSKVDDKKAQKCYYCGEDFETINEIVFTKVPLVVNTVDEDGHAVTKVKQMNRKFHLNCLMEYNSHMNNVEERRIENSDWDNLYLYVKKEILQQPSHIPLDKFCVERLLGLRLGKYIPRGQNVRGLKRGFDYSMILTTFKVCRNRILTAFRENVGIKDNQHRVNLMMKIVTSQIWEIQRRMDKMKEQELIDVAQKEKNEEQERIKEEIGYSSYSDALSNERQKELEAQRELRKKKLEKKKALEVLATESKNSQLQDDDDFDLEMQELAKEFGL